jgi:hypothetical protein
MADGIIVGHSVSLSHMTHMMVILHNEWLISISLFITGIIFCWCIMNICQYVNVSLFLHSIAVKSPLVFTWMSLSHHFGLICMGPRSCGMPFLFVMTVPNQFSFLSSHQISQRRRRNCSCIICHHILVSQSSLSLWHVLLSLLSQVHF